jgi:hypothetical protein
VEKRPVGHVDRVKQHSLADRLFRCCYGHHRTVQGSCFATTTISL